MSGKKAEAYEARRKRVKKQWDEAWAAHWAELKTDPEGFERRRRNLPPVTVRAYPRG